MLGTFMLGSMGGGWAMLPAVSSSSCFKFTLLSGCVYVSLLHSLVEMIGTDFMCEEVLHKPGMQLMMVRCGA